MFSFEEHKDDLILVGGCRPQKPQMEWVFANRLYNVRSNADLFVSRPGGFDNCPLPKFILIYEEGSFQKKHLYECLGAMQKTQHEMEGMGYENSHGAYITYVLGDEHQIPRSNIKKLIETRPPKTKKDKYDYSPMLITGEELGRYMKPTQKQANPLKLGYPLRVGTLFSGIGAFEEALKQLKVPHQIKFACDNGEIELVLLDDKDNRKAYLDLNRRVRKLDAAEKEKLNRYKNLINQRVDEIREYCYNLPTKEQRTRFVNDLYRRYEGEHRNYVRESYLANYDIDPNDFHPDIRFMRGDDYAGQVDILVGGSPCQSFSTYGKKQGLEDARGTLFYDYARFSDVSNYKQLFEHRKKYFMEALKDKRTYLLNN